MSQALSIIAGRLREDVEDLVLSPALTRAMVFAAEVSDDVRAEALAMLQRAERRGARSGVALAFEWIALINIASARPMTPEVFALRSRVVAEAIAHWPVLITRRSSPPEGPQGNCRGAVAFGREVAWKICTGR